jgi:hypothetical protein
MLAQVIQGIFGCNLAKSTAIIRLKVVWIDKIFAISFMLITIAYPDEATRCLFIACLISFGSDL